MIVDVFYLTNIKAKQMKRPARLNPRANPEGGKTPKCSCYDEA